MPRLRALIASVAGGLLVFAVIGFWLRWPMYLSVTLAALLGVVFLMMAAALDDEGAAADLAWRAAAADLLGVDVAGTSPADAPDTGAGIEPGGESGAGPEEGVEFGARRIGAPRIDACGRPGWSDDPARRRGRTVSDRGRATERRPGPGAERISSTRRDGPRARLAAAGLDPSSWSNGPGDVYAVHRHEYDKVLVVERGSIVFGLPQHGEIVALEVGDRLDLPAGTDHDARVGPEGVTCLEAHCPRGTLEARPRMLREPEWG